MQHLVMDSVPNAIRKIKCLQRMRQKPVFFKVRIARESIQNAQLFCRHPRPHRILSSLHRAFLVLAP